MNGKPTAVKFEKTDDYGGGCKHGNCASNYVVIDHDPSETGLLDRAGYRYSAYYHLQKGSNRHLDVGDEVAMSAIIGKMGSSGQSLTPHLHFEAHKEAIEVSSVGPDSLGRKPSNADFWNSLVDPFY